MQPIGLIETRCSAFKHEGVSGKVGSRPYLRHLLVSARAGEVVQEDAMCNESVHMRGDIPIEHHSIIYSIIRCRRDYYLTRFESQ